MIGGVVRRFDQMPCSLARTVDVVGEWWTPLVLRELFYGVDRFDELVARLDVSRKVLAQRLARLEEAGVVQRRPDADDARVRTIRLTPAGRELFDVVVALVAWGDRHLRPDGEPPPVSLVHRCGQTLQPRLRCNACDEPLEPRDVTPVPNLGQDLPRS